MASGSHALSDSDPELSLVIWALATKDRNDVLSKSKFRIL